MDDDELAGLEGDDLLREIAKEARGARQAAWWAMTIAALILLAVLFLLSRGVEVRVDGT